MSAFMSASRLSRLSVVCLRTSVSVSVPVFVASAGAGLAFAAGCGGDRGVPIPDSVGVEVPAPSASADPAAPSPGTPAPEAASSFALKVVVEGAGSVRSVPAGIDCSAIGPALANACTARFRAGTQVTLTMVPSEGWTLTGWRGACSGPGACALTLSADTTVTGSLAQLDARWDPSVGKEDCPDAWGSAGDKLSACDIIKDNYVVVRKSKRNTALCKQGALVRNFRSGLGSMPVGPKEKQGDGRTPEGVFYVPRIVPESAYHRALIISYPTPAIAEKGFAAQLITTAQRLQILRAYAACVEPPQKTALGGELAISGNGPDAPGSGKDWTIGSVALDDAAMDVVWAAMGVGDTVVVLP